MEEALAAVSSPCSRGTIQIVADAKGSISYTGSFNTGDETISKTHVSLVLCAGWIGQMQASLESGKLRKGMKLMQKPTPGTDALCCIYFCIN